MNTITTFSIEALQTDCLPIKGVRLASAAAGIRYQGRDDLCVIEIPAQGTVAAVFTRNQFCAAPVALAKQHLGQSNVRYLLINSGNANAGTGSPGLEAAQATCQLLADLTGCQATQVLPFSTGVIGEDLPIAPFTQALPAALDALDENAWQAAAACIMTTDTRPKCCSRQVQLEQGRVTITGIAKGSGMIRPDMATMLAYIATDAQVEQDALQTMLQTAVEPSFNAISVDGDTSTNDACVLIASGASHVAPATAQDQHQLQAAIDAVCLYLAREIVRDGEGATKLVDVCVKGARNTKDARAVADTIAHSPLVKTAVFASDPNWGRILAAVGRAGVADLAIDAVHIALDDVTIVSHGGRDPAYREEDGQRVMDQSEFAIHVDLGMGQAKAHVLTCDLSYDYVKINAEYRS